MRAPESRVRFAPSYQDDIDRIATINSRRVSAITHAVVMVAAFAFIVYGLGLI